MTWGVKHYGEEIISRLFFMYQQGHTAITHNKRKSSLQGDALLIARFARSPDQLLWDCPSRRTEVLMFWENSSSLDFRRMDQHYKTTEISFDGNSLRVSVLTYSLTIFLNSLKKRVIYYVWILFDLLTLLVELEIWFESSCRKTGSYNLH